MNGVAARFKLPDHNGRQVFLDGHVLVARDIDLEPGRVQRLLRVHYMVDHVRYDLQVALWLLESAHDPEAEPHLVVSCRHRRDDRLERPLVAFKVIGVVGVE